MNRALRRHYTERRKRRVSVIHPWAADDPRMVGILAGTRRTCSCPVCKRMRYIRAKAARQWRMEIDRLKAENERLMARIEHQDALLRPPSTYPIDGMVWARSSGGTTMEPHLIRALPPGVMCVDSGNRVVACLQGVETA